jgi:hypothetical protein
MCCIKITREIKNKNGGDSMKFYKLHNNRSIKNSIICHSEKNLEIDNFELCIGKKI